LDARFLAAGREDQEEGVPGGARRRRRPPGVGRQRPGPEEDLGPWRRRRPERWRESARAGVTEEEKAGLPTAHRGSCFEKKKIQSPEGHLIVSYSQVILL
jgi:hypothetical protein